MKYTPEQIYAHFEFTSGYKVDVQGTFYPSLIRKAIVQVREMEQAHITNSYVVKFMPITNIEFYNTPEGDVMIKELGHAAVVLCEDNRPTIEYMLAVIRDRYPKAHARLMQLYSSSTMNRWHYEFRVVHRFIRCNFGEYDQYNLDINKDGQFVFEEVNAHYEVSANMRE